MQAFSYNRAKRYSRISAQLWPPISTKTEPVGLLCFVLILFCRSNMVRSRAIEGAYLAFCQVCHTDGKNRPGLDDNCFCKTHVIVS